MWTMPRCTVQTKLRKNWSFKQLIFWLRICPSPLYSILCHSTSVGISFCRSCKRVTISVQDVLLFLFLKSWWSTCRILNQGAFSSLRSFSVRWGSSIRVVVKYLDRIPPQPFLTSVFPYRNSAKHSTGRRLLQSGQWSLGKMVSKKQSAHSKIEIFKERIL